MRCRPLLIVALLACIASTASVSAARAQSQGVAPPVPADVAAAPADAARTASGLASKMLAAGSGSEKPEPTDIVTVHYSGWTTDGKMFDSSVARATPAMFALDRAIAGMRECLQLMTVGERRRCWIPQELGYGGRAGRPQGTTVFDLELIDTQRPPTMAPPDVDGIPLDAMRTASGLSYRILRKGSGSRHPSGGSRVTVHYTGWTRDGKMFDSSIARGMPASFSLGDVIRGWTEGVQLMVEGERTRFWIPESLAYRGQSGAPRGMLVFDIELIRIDR